MKIVCTKENLKHALSLCSKAVSSVSTLPILNNLLLKINNGQLEIFSTNLEIAIKTWIGGQVEQVGQITVPARTITDYINNIAEDKVTLETKGSDLLIKSRQTESLLKGLPADEFPLIPEIKPLASVTLAAQELSQALSQVVFAAAFSETQPELSGVLFYFQDNTLRLAATDRYRLAERTLTLPREFKEPLKVIVPNRAMAELIRILADSEKSVEVVIAENQILFRTDTSELISRLIEAQYPDYQQIIPKEFVTKAQLNVSDLASAVKLSGLFASDNNNIELKINKSGTITLKAFSQRSGSNTTEVTAEVSGEDNTIIFNYRYILDCLNHVSQKKAELKVIDSGSPAMIVPAGVEDCLYLVMPIRT